MCAIAKGQCDYSCVCVCLCVRVECTLRCNMYVIVEHIYSALCSAMYTSSFTYMPLHSVT